MTSKLKVDEIVDSTDTGSPTFPFGTATTNLSYTGTLTGGTGVINIGSGQVVKDANGNVGIGTSSPSTKLNITESSNAGSIAVTTFSANNSAAVKTDYVQFQPNIEFNVATSEAGGYKIRIKQQGVYKNSIVAEGITNNASNYLAFSTTNEAMRITTSGNVGIGTTFATDPLTVNQTVNDSVVARFNNTGGGSGSVRGIGYIGLGIFSASNIGSYIGWDQVNLSGFQQALTFGTRGSADVFPSERMRIDAAGNVGIGTSLPATTLSVVGGVTISRTAVTAPAASDGNVFSGTYTPTLTNSANVTSSTSGVCQYMRVGKVITVSGQVTGINLTGASSSTIDVSLPVASVFGATRQCAGTCTFFTVTLKGQSGTIVANTTSNIARIDFTPSTSATNQLLVFSFTYLVT